MTCGAIAARPDPRDGMRVGHESVSGASDQAGYTFKEKGSQLFEQIGATLESGSWVRCCVDWTEQRHHIAGPHGRVILQRFLELGWLCRSARGRAVTMTEGGYAGLSEWIGLDRSQLS